MTTTKTRRTRKVATTDIVPKGPCVGFEAVDHLIWRAQAASSPAAVYVDLTGFDDALASLRSNVDDAIAEHAKRAEDYDLRESVLRGQRKLKPAQAKRRVPVAAVTESGTFYAIDAMDAKAEKALDRLKAAWAEEDGTPIDDPGPVPAAHPPAPRETDPAGPGSQDEPALDKAPDDSA